MKDLLYPNMRVLFCVPFQQIDSNEIIIKRLKLKTGPVKVQVVSLPFNRDQGGVKLGFKGINLNKPNFQNEFIYMDLELSNEELQSDETKINEILEKLQIDQ